MSKAIKVYCRVRPSKRASSRSYRLDKDNSMVQFNVARDTQGGRDINHNKEEYKFKFSGVFDVDSTQDQVFEGIAHDAVASALEGYNGTIFAYGQTGSGKTFTITGGPENYQDRGIIPRAIEMVFAEAAKHRDTKTSVEISYLEIYNNSGYDLLDPNHEGKSLEDLPKVTMREGDDGVVHMSNLGRFPVASREEALNLLFVGDTNRIICETPMNDTSSRSHCIFTLNISRRTIGGAKVRRSKLHLVDLAGSERTKKTKVNGKIFTEACHINLSLHFLEQVIVALHRKKRGKGPHVPYRNSMMTSVLKDSLGGNCRTAMIATCSPAPEHISESISTCRFAQRVAQIQNDAVVNEETDPKLVIAALRQQVRELKDQLAMAQGQGKSLDAERRLMPEEMTRCAEIVAQFVNQGDESPITLVHPAKVRYCFSLLRKRAVQDGDGGRSKGGGAAGAAQSGAAGRAGDVAKLRADLKSRDKEIATLRKMLREAVPQQQRAPGASPKTQAKEAKTQNGTSSAMRKLTAAVPLAQEDKDALLTRQAAFERFKASYSKGSRMQTLRQELKSRYVDAKQIGSRINKLRDAIKGLTSALQTHRMRKAVQSIDGADESGAAAQGHEAGDASDPEERRLIHELKVQKDEYRSDFRKLKEQKQAIEHAQRLIEQARKRVRRDFERWWQEQQHDAKKKPSPERPAPREQGGAKLTGDPSLDADIAAFYRARNDLQ